MQVLSRVYCAVCAKSYCNRDVVIKHLKTHVKDAPSPFICNECGAAFKLRGCLIRHSFKHKTEKAFACEHCSATFKAPFSLTSHRRFVHASAKSFACPKCTATFVSASKLKRHSIVHTLERRFKCAVCAERFRDAAALTSHLRQVHYCQKTFKCNLCPKSFAFRADIQRHLSVHSDQRPYQCAVCSASFKNCQYWRAHERGHVAAPVKAFECLLCGRTFRKSSDLARHLQVVHTEKRPFGCSRCQVRFKFKANLCRHIETKHVDLKPKFVYCAWCEASCNNKGALYKHLWEIHLIARPPFVAAQHALRKREAVRPAGIGGPIVVARYHLNSEQPSARPFQCSFCLATFFWKSSCRSHLQHHLLPLTCARCGLRLSDKRAVSMHLSTAHAALPAPLYSCPHCLHGFRFKRNLKVHLARYIKLAN